MSRCFYNQAGILPNIPDQAKQTRLRDSGFKLRQGKQAPPTWKPGRLQLNASRLLWTLTTPSPPSSLHQPETFRSWLEDATAPPPLHTKQQTVSRKALKTKLWARHCAEILSPCLAESGGYMAPEVVANSCPGLGCVDGFPTRQKKSTRVLGGCKEVFQATSRRCASNPFV